MKNILITGGAGFIGKRLALSLRELGCGVTVFDNLHSQVHSDPDGVLHELKSSNVNVVLGDVRDIEKLQAALVDHDIGIVVHLAAETGTGQSYELPQRYCDVNVTGTASLIEAVRESASLGLKVDRLILASSRAVYGEGACRRSDGCLVTAIPRRSNDLSKGDFEPKDSDGSSVTPLASKSDTTVPAPASVYASTKLMQEYLVRQGLEQTGISPGIVRLQNVYGAGQSLFNPYTGVLSIFAQQLLKGQDLNIFEDGEIVRDFVYVADVVDALQRLCLVHQVPNKTIDIGSGRPVSILRIARMMIENLDLPADRLRVSGQFRPGDVRHALADIEDARSLLGWAPKMRLEQGLGELLDWARRTL